MNQPLKNIGNDEVRVPHYAIHKDGKICGFFGPFRFLSNFYILENGVWFEELTYPSVEHAYQAAKWPAEGTHLYEGNRTASRLAFLDILPGEAKYLGKMAPNFDSKKWNKYKVNLMHSLCWQKFEKNPTLRKMLLMTEDCHLEERNSWGDEFWGTDVSGDGENQLGKILMKIRDGFQLIEKGEPF